MLLRPLTVATGLLALPATQAFLLPPEVSEAEAQIANTIESVSSQVAESQVVNVECPGCPILVHGRKDPKKSFQLKIHRPNHLELAFSVDHQPDHDRLLVNGFELYPAGDPLHETLSAPQVVDWDKRVKRHHREHDHDDRRGDRHRRPPHGDHDEHDRPDWHHKPPHGDHGEHDRPDWHHKPPHGDHGEHDRPDWHHEPPHGDRPDGHRKPHHGDHGEHDGPDGHRKPPHGDRPDGHRKPPHDGPDGHRKPHHGDHGEHGHHGNHTDSHNERPHRLTPQPQRLGFGLQVGPSQKDADGQFELVEVELQIIEVGSAFIDGIPSVKVKLIKDGQGRLLMSQIDKSLPKYPDGPEDDAEECTTILCRWLAIARQKLKGFKGFGNCHGGKVDELDHPEGPHHPHPPPPPPHHDPHHSHPPPPHHDPHHRPHHPPAGDFWPGAFEERRWGKLPAYIASHILLPILIGIVAGVSVSLVGMAAGTLAIAIWRLLFRRRSGRGHRRHHSGHAHHHAARKEVALSDEKSGLMAYQDEPPSYEDEEAAKPPQA